MSKADRDERVARLKRDKSRIRARFTRVPLMDWFRRDPVPKRHAGVRLEKHDVLAMILAALSLVIPWTLLLSSAMALLVFLLRLWLIS